MSSYRNVSEIAAVGGQGEVATEEWVQATPWTAEAVLAVLRDPAAPEDRRRQAVLEAEVLDLAPEQVAEFHSHLFDFIATHRKSVDQETLIAVGSAIRKMVAYLRTEELEQLAPLLEPDPTEPVALDVEQELAKVIVRKLVARLPVEDDASPELSKRLCELARAYLHPCLVGRAKYGSVALNAAVAVVLLRSTHALAVTEAVLASGARWLMELARDRIPRRGPDGCELSQPARAFLDRIENATRA